MSRAMFRRRAHRRADVKAGTKYQHFTMPAWTLEPLMTPAEVAELLRVPENTLTQWRHRNTGPKFVKVGASVRYKPADVRSWLDDGGRTNV
jgi:excisionase family DNA binding protein